MDDFLRVMNKEYKVNEAMLMPPIRADYLLTSLVPKEKADDSLGTLPLDNEKIILRSTLYASNARATINTLLKVIGTLGK